MLVTWKAAGTKLNEMNNQTEWKIGTKMERIRDHYRTLGTSHADKPHTNISLKDFAFSSLNVCNDGHLKITNAIRSFNILSRRSICTWNRPCKNEHGAEYCIYVAREGLGQFRVFLILTTEAVIR